MKQRIMEALHNEQWMEETHKSGYQKFLEKVAHDSLWNIRNVLTKYGREHRPGDVAFANVIARADFFASCLRPYTKSRNRARSIPWWTSQAGLAQENSMRRHLVVLPPTAIVVPVDNMPRRGGYATIRRVRLEGVSEFPAWWEFAAKQSIQIDSHPTIARLEHQNESMAVTIPHAGVIRFVAVHAQRYEGYAFWWNGGTLRDMFNLDNYYGEDIHARVA